MSVAAIWAIGLNHETAALDWRSRFALSPADIPQQVAKLQHQLAQTWPQTEVSLLSTCNRVEIYGTGDPASAKAAAHWLADLGQVSPQDFAQHAYTHTGAAAARHVFRVASGLDSMVLGETQILGQMKDALRQASEANTLGRTLRQLFDRGFHVAKAVRSQTDIGTHSISMAAAAVRLAAQVFEDLQRCRVLFVGAGEMVALAASHFAAQQPLKMTVANRSPERAQALVDKLGAHTLQLMRLADVPQHLHEFDVVVSCTASSLPIIGLGAVQQALRLRKHQPMVMVDLAVPRDIEPQVQQLRDVFLYTVDDLATIVQQGVAQRIAASGQAQHMVDAGVDEFMQWLQSRAHVPLIQSLHEQVQSWNAQEIAKAQKLLDKGQDANAVLQSLARGISQKMLHGVLADLSSTNADDRARAVQAIERYLLKQDD